MESDGVVKLESRLRAPAFVDADWDRHRDLITRMYTYENKRLKDIKEYMRREFGLDATERMYKARLTRWKVNKYFRKEEVLAIGRVKARRDHRSKGHETSLFFCRGQHIDFSRIERYLREHPDVSKELQKLIRVDRQTSQWPEIYLPSDIRVVSVDPAPSLSGETINTGMEKALFAMESRALVPTGSKFPSRFYDTLNTAARLLGQQASGLSPSQEESVKIQTLLRQTSATLESQIKLDDPVLAFQIIPTMSKLVAELKAPELAYHFVSFAQQLSQTIHGPAHPLVAILSQLFRVLRDPEQTKAMSEKATRLSYDLACDGRMKDWSSRVWAIASISIHGGGSHAKSAQQLITLSPQAQTRYDAMEVLEHAADLARQVYDWDTVLSALNLAERTCGLDEDGLSEFVFVYTARGQFEEAEAAFVRYLAFWKENHCEESSISYTIRWIGKVMGLFQKGIELPDSFKQRMKEAEEMGWSQLENKVGDLSLHDKPIPT